MLQSDDWLGATLVDIFGLAKVALKQPYWIIVFIVGAAMIALPCVGYKNGVWAAQEPNSWFLIYAGIILIVVSLLAFAISIALDFRAKRDASIQLASGAGLDVSRVKEAGSTLSTKIGNCEISVILGRLEKYHSSGESVVVLPCNEYFDDHCVEDLKGALGAYVSFKFAGRIKEFTELVEHQRQERLGLPTMRRKLGNEEGASFGAGRALLLKNPLNTNQPIALISTTTQRAEEGLIARISYLFEGMKELITTLSETPRASEIVMPLLGAGRGGISSPLALVGLLLALAEAVRYGAGPRQLRKVSIIVLLRDEHSKPEVDPFVIRRALALITQEG